MGSGAGARAGTGAGGSLLAFLLFKDLKDFRYLEFLRYLSWDWHRRLLTGFPPFEGLLTSIEVGPPKIETIGTLLEDVSTIPVD